MLKRNIAIRDVNDFLNRFAPPSLAEDWDNIGLQVGSLKPKVNGILVSLDVTEAVLWEASSHDCNLLITHHPLILRPIPNLDDSTMVQRCAQLAVQMEVNILSFHTNLDSTQEGLNDLLATQLKLKNLKPLFPTRDPHQPKAGLGRIGKLPKTTVKKFLPQISKLLQLKKFRFVGDPDHPIQRVAVLTGSGGGYFREAKNAGADLFITGDVKYHQALEALEEGIPVVDIGHFAGEFGMVSLVAQKLRQWAKKRKFSFSILETVEQADPFQFWSHHSS
jgi:dinuclear metal center YbgI/SA1388 family protein